MMTDFSIDLNLAVSAAETAPDGVGVLPESAATPVDPALKLVDAQNEAAMRFRAEMEQPIKDNSAAQLAFESAVRSFSENLHDFSFGFAAKSAGSDPVSAQTALPVDNDVVSGKTALPTAPDAAMVGAVPRTARGPVAVDTIVPESLVVGRAASPLAAASADGPKVAVASAPAVAPAPQPVGAAGTPRPTIMADPAAVGAVVADSAAVGAVVADSPAVGRATVDPAAVGRATVDPAAVGRAASPLAAASAEIPKVVVASAPAVAPAPQTVGVAGTPRPTIMADPVVVGAVMADPVVVGRAASPLAAASAEIPNVIVASAPAVAPAPQPVGAAGTPRPTMISDPAVVGAVVADSVAVGTVVSDSSAVGAVVADPATVGRAASPLAAASVEIPKVVVASAPAVAPAPQTVGAAGRPRPTMISDPAAVGAVVADLAEVGAVAVDSNDAEAVGEVRVAAEALVAAGVVPPTAVEATRSVGAPPAVAAVEAVEARTVEMVARVEKAMTASDVLVAAAEAVADAIMVSPDLWRGEGEIRIQLKPEVLEGSEVRIAVTGRQMNVEFMPTAENVAMFIERYRPQFEQQLAARIHAFNVAVAVKEGVPSIGRRRRAGEAEA